MSIETNQTTIQLLKILSSQTKIKKQRNTHIQTIYPKAIENRYKRKLSSYFKPLLDYVNKFLSENMEDILKGDSKERFDSIPGDTYRRMVKNMESWISVNLPSISDSDSDLENVVYAGMKSTALELKGFQDKEFNKQLEKSINVSIKEQADWWESMSDSWADNNYNLIRSNASAFTSKINTIVEQAVVNGTSPSELKKEIQRATTGLSDAKCKLLARDQIGKLQGQISQAQMTEVGLEMYIWSTSGDERVRDSHREMEGLLCRWDDSSVYSPDGGKTWIDRPSGAIDMHPGQDIQCRCVALAYFPEIESVVTGEPMEIIESEVALKTEIKQLDYLEENFEELKTLGFNTLEKYDVNDIQKIVGERTAFVNPHFSDSKYMHKGYKKYQYTENCQRCCPTFEMVMRGFDVTALPLPKKTPDFDDMMYGGRWRDWLRNKDGTNSTATNIGEKLKDQLLISPSSLKNATIDEIKKTPQGSRFELKCNWKGGGGHVFSAVSMGDKGVIFLDSQTMDFQVADYYFDYIKPDSLEIIRTDDKIIDLERIKQCCKNSK